MQERKIIHNANSWKDLNKTLESFTKSNRTKFAGDIFEYLTKLYLETAPQYKSKLKRVFLEKEVPSSLRRRLNLPDRDEGIDIIAETYDKEYWAIQCKYRSNSNETLTIKEDLSTFNNLAFTHCKNITHGIVCATVNKPPRKLKLLKSIGFELLETWLALDDGDLFTQIKAKCVGKKYKPNILKPRPHQVAAIRKTIEHFKSNERGKIIMPCGTGKSLTAFWIAKQMGVKSILIAVPSLALLQQTLKVWTREFLINGIEPEWFCVCSDNTVKDEQDDYVNDTADLGIKVDTDPSLIKQFLKKKTSKIKVVFTTYQSGRATAKGSKGFTYDLGIMDEAHKTVGSKTKEMAHLLHQKNIKIKKRISMTATERLFRGDSDEFMSMDDPRDYGSLIYELSFKEAIKSKPPIISDYKIITFGITTPEIQEIYESNKYLEVKKILKDITAREFATALALRKAIKQFKINNAISFHRSIKRASNFRTQQDLITKIYPEYGKLKSFHVAGDMPTSARATQMREFSKGKGLMTNARCLTEGVDLPAIDCVCFTDPKRSKVDIVQAAGRALRLSKGKKFGYILIPIFIPDGADFNEAAEEQGFDDVAITVRALATSDTRITEYLRVISEGKKPKGGSPVEGITSVNSLYKIEAEEFDKAIKLKIWNKVAVGNWRSYQEAKKFVHNYNREKKLKDFKDWLKECRSGKIPLDIPSYPNQMYKNQYEGMKKWLNLDITYNEAKDILKNLNIKSVSEYGRKHKALLSKYNLPYNPERKYKESWKDWGDYLDTIIVAPQNKDKSFFISYKELKKLLIKNKVTTSQKWRVFYKKMKQKGIDIPSRPSELYKDEWISLSELFGTGNRLHNQPYVTYQKAKKIIRKLNIESQGEFVKFRKTKKFKSLNIPSNPNREYKEFEGFEIFLNSRQYKKRKSFLSFEQAKRFVKKLNIESEKKWILLKKSKNFPKNLPRTPQKVYRKDWKGWNNFLGKKK